MYKKLYSRFLSSHQDELHFACHSHHYWPDVTREAQVQYWDDSCKFVDDKWSYFFSTKVPQAQTHIAKVLGLSSPSQIVFSPNTHEMVFRLLSSLDWTKKVRILTTDSEFYSFDRQINRLTELSQFEVVKIPTLPLTTFNERFEKALTEQSWDLVFISHVFFNSGWACDIERLVQANTNKSTFVIDGYHSFMAVPLNLAAIEEKVFYLGGSYKYAQGGEGACFLYVPKGTRHRPFYTGWFAELSHLSSVGNEVGYPLDALQYAGSTMDFSGLYRLIAVMDLFNELNLDTFKIHNFVQRNQNLFLTYLDSASHPLFNRKNLLLEKLSSHGHFLTFILDSDKTTQETVKKLNQNKVKTDSRGTRLRFGFGLYHDEQDIEKVCKIITSL